MVNKYILMLLLIVGVSTLKAQPYRENGGTIFKDAMNGKKVIKLLDERSEGDFASYYYSIKDTLVHNVMFMGGYDCLMQHFDSVYYASFGDCYKEVDKYVVCSILFDEKLKIKEICILDAYSDPLFLKPYYKLIEKALLSTEGKWYRKKNNTTPKGAIFLFTKRISVVPEHY